MCVSVMCVQLIHFIVLLKLAQHCKSTILQDSFFKKREIFVLFLTLG